MSSPVSTSENNNKGRIYHETYGCQMNVNDMEIVLSIMTKFWVCRSREGA